jgi:mannosyltransferase OCH1-like enzyme
MEISFIFYLTFIVLIFGIIFIVCLRNKSVHDYRNNFFSKNNEPIKYIPKKIYQLISDKNKISSEFQKNINYIKNLNPDWEYTLYDDNDMINYIVSNYGYDMLKYYNKINPKYGAAKADFFRYLLMYIEGGVYLDIKSAIKFPLNEVILSDDEYLISHWDFPNMVREVDPSYGEYQQWHIICRPYHPFLHAVINKVIENIDNYSIQRFGVGKNGVLRVTGPIAYTNAIYPIIEQHNHRMIDLNDSIGLIYNNLKKSHINLFSKTHYSKITEPIIISKING